MPTPGVVVVTIRIPAPPPRDPTILEMMLLIGLFMGYGKSVRRSANLMSFQFTDMPDDVNAYWLWMHIRPWD